MAKLTPIAAIDRIVDGKLVHTAFFRTERGATIPKVFSDDHITIQHEGKLYDWYGREFDLDPEISRILQFYAGVALYGEGYEQFIVRLSNGKFAIARTEMVPEPDAPIIPAHKDIATAGRLGRKPHLKVEQPFEDMDTMVIETPVFQTLLRLRKEPDRQLVVFYGYGDKGDDATVIARPGDWVASLERLKITDTPRAEVMNGEADIEPRRCKLVTTSLVGGFELSGNGRKLTACASNGWRVSTDVDFLEHIGAGLKGSIWWYHDPI